MAIRSFRGGKTEAVARGDIPKGFQADIARSALRKLAMIDSAARLEDLRVPPGNRLEALKGEWAGFHSIRVNDQWRIVFRWAEGGAEDVAIVDYH